MVLSAEDIHNKKFSTKMRGYNIDEVNDFLDQVTKDYAILKDENDKLKATVAKNDEQLHYYDNLSTSLNQSILVAQEAADKVKQQADEDANQTIAAAQSKADEIVSDATIKANNLIDQSSKEATALAVSTDDFRNSIKSFREKMIGMLQSQLDFANNSEWAELLNGADYQNFSGVNQIVDATKQAGNVDNVAPQSVESDQGSNRSETSEPEVVIKPVDTKYANPTIEIYPQG